MCISHHLMLVRRTHVYIEHAAARALNHASLVVQHKVAHVQVQQVIHAVRALSTERRAVRPEWRCVQPFLGGDRQIHVFIDDATCQ